MVYFIRKDKLSLFFLIFLLLGIPTFAFCNTTSSTTENYTTELIKLNGILVNGFKLDGAALVSATKTARLRREALHALLIKDPNQANKYLLPKKITSTLPSSLSPYIEKEVVNVKGTVEVRIATPSSPSKEEYISYVLHADNGKIYKLYFSEGAPEGIQTNTKINVKKATLVPGINTIDDLIISSNEALALTPVTALPEAFGPQKTIVMLVNFQDQPTVQPFTPAAVKTNFFTTVNNIYYESSFHQTTVVGDVAGWFTIAMNSTVSCDTILDDLPAMAEAATTAAGFNLANYDRRVYIFPRSSACSWGGYGSVGKWGAYSMAWLNGENSNYLAGHELGHNLGLYHSQRLACSGSPNQGSCSRVTYGDRADIMGYGNTAHFNAYQKDRLGWLNYLSSPPIQTVNASGTFTIDPYETFNTNVKALKILKKTLSNGSKDYYYVEFRQPIGFDAGLNCSNCDFTKGVLIHQGNSVDANTSNLLDMSFNDGNGDFLVALLPGQSFTDTTADNGGITITSNTIATTGATVTVTIGGTQPTCTRALQTMSISPTTTQYVPPGGNYTYVVTLKNNDSTACLATNFSLAATAPANVTASLSTASLNLAPQATGTVNVTVGSTTSTPPGIYTVPVKATSGSVPANVTTVNANFGVQAPVCTLANPTVTITPAIQSAPAETTLTYAVSIVNNNSTGCPNATYNLTARYPSMFIGNLSAASVTLPSGGTGSVSVNVWAPLEAQPGDFKLRLTATNATTATSTATGQAVYRVQ